mgnify:FL=1
MKDRPADLKRKPPKSQGERRVENVASDLSKYFFNEPEAGDTLEAIASWWVTRQSRANAMSIVRSALEHLVETGEVTKRSYGDKELYVSSRKD